MAVSYTPLEPDLESTIGGGVSFTTASPATLFTSASFVYTFAFVVIVVAASFRYAHAGALRMSATEKGIQESKGEFKRVTYGLLGVFALWLVLYTVNKDMLTGNVSLSGLKATPGMGTIGAVVPTTGTTNTSNTPSSELAGKILSKANNYIGTSTNVPNTNNGRSACAYAVNEVLKIAGIKTLGTNTLSVVDIKSDLDRGRGIMVNQSNAQGGDLVLVTSVMKGNHIGICLNSGCSRVISNSSGNASFSWQSGPDFCPSYCFGVGTIYHLTN